VVHFDHVYDVWLDLAQGTCIWYYSFPQRVGKPITKYSLRAVISPREVV